MEEFQAAIRIAPDDVFGYGNLAGSYASLGKLDEAHKTLETAVARGVSSSPVAVVRLR
jgi:hypothetical protein